MSVAFCTLVLNVQGPVCPTVEPKARAVQNMSNVVFAQPTLTRPHVNLQQTDEIHEGIYLPFFTQVSLLTLVFELSRKYWDCLHVSIQKQISAVLVTKKGTWNARNERR